MFGKRVGIRLGFIGGGVLLMIEVRKFLIVGVEINL